MRNTKITPNKLANDTTVKPILPAELPTIIDMLSEFASYAETSEPLQNSVEKLSAAMFGNRSSLLGYIARQNAAPAGMILGYETYSTFSGKGRLFIEDLFVRAKYRGHGFGLALVGAFARRALAGGCVEVHWRVQEQNASGIRFYSSLGATITTEHRNCSLADAALRALAESFDPSAAPGSVASRCRPDYSLSSIRLAMERC